VRGYIPNRFDEGYGLNNEALDSLKAAGVKLVVTVDCGIRSIEEAQHAARIGLDLIISDHHHPAPDLPHAAAVINPKQPGDAYGDKDLAGVGLAYKLATALFAAQDQTAESYLDLVAIGTVADLAPLRGENRSLVRNGIVYLKRPARQGILSLIHAAGIAAPQLNAAQIGFALGPRLNAAGRLESAQAALDLLLTDEPSVAGLLAQQLDSQNRERQRITQEIQQQAEAIALAGDPQALLLFAAHPDFNPGVVGLAASRLTERYYRPAIVAYQGETFTRGSCRSIPEFHITRALDECADLLEHHGGHAAAAGFTVQNDRLPELVDRLQIIAREELSSLDLRRTIKADKELTLSDLHPDILQDLKWLEPTGQANPQAVFVSRELEIKRARRVGRDETHLKLDVTDGWMTFPAIAFQQGYWYEHLPPRVDLIYNYEQNEYNGQISLQLNVIDIKPSGTPD
jgi:single-stranded-DNA-specific exonuclease